MPLRLGLFKTGEGLLEEPGENRPEVRLFLEALKQEAEEATAA